MLKLQLLSGLYADVPWVDIYPSLGAKRRYNNRYSSTALLAAHTLPYILPLVSERALADELKERPDLRRICGFEVGDQYPIPNRGTLWHFRKRHTGFVSALLQSLYCLAVLAEARGITLPFVSRSRSATATEVDLRGIAFEISAWNVTGIFVVCHSRRPAPERDEITEQLLLPEMGRSPSPLPLQAPRRSAAKESLGADVGFPVTVIAGKAARPQRAILLDRPEWLGGPERRDLADLGPAFGNQNYTAVNVLVFDNDTSKLLLAKRLTGYGAGTFTIPGGKLRPGETILAAAKRELREEAGLTLLEARPISVRYGRKSDDSPLVRSVGLLAAKFTGTPQRTHRERQQLGTWHWYPVHSLPQPLFQPSAWVISDFLQHDLSQITWSDLEEGSERFLPLWQIQSS